jgi:hypothetical protein
MTVNNPIDAHRPACRASWPSLVAVGLLSLWGLKCGKTEAGTDARADGSDPTDAASGGEGGEGAGGPGAGGASGTGGTSCTDACVAGATQCLSTGDLEVCAAGGNGCTAPTTTACATGLACERYPPAACVDPSWAEWPMPNGQADVDAGAPNLAGYLDNRDGTVTDNVTGLMWQQDFATGLAQPAAVTYCRSALAAGGYHDWRLPSVIELVSLVDYGQSSPSIDGTLFPSTPASNFWSSTPVAGSTSTAWNVHFAAGLTGSLDATTPVAVRCVR